MEKSCTCDRIPSEFIRVWTGWDSEVVRLGPQEILDHGKLFGVDIMFACASLSDEITPPPSIDLILAELLLCELSGLFQNFQTRRRSFLRLQRLYCRALPVLLPPHVPQPLQSHRSQIRLQDPLYL